MQALKNLFTRPQVQAAAEAAPSQPTELTPEALALVGGGLPRIGGFGSGAVALPPAADSATTLPKAS